MLLEHMFRENCRGSGRRMHEINCPGRASDRMRGGNLHFDLVRLTNLFARHRGCPGLAKRFKKIGPASAQRSLSLGHLPLHDLAAGQRGRRETGRLRTGQFYQSVDGGARHPQRGGRKQGYRNPYRQTIERTLKSLGGCLERFHQGSMSLRNELVLNRNIMASGAAHPERVPGVQDLDLVRRHEHEPTERDALLVGSKFVPIPDLHKKQEPVTMMRTADEWPLSAEAIAALDGDRRGTRRERGA